MLLFLAILVVTLRAARVLKETVAWLAATASSQGACRARGLALRRRARLARSAWPWSAVWGAPFVWMVVDLAEAFLAGHDAATIEWLPREVTFDNYAQGLSNTRSAPGP